MIRVFRAAFWFEATSNSRTYGQWMPVITAPLYTAIFLAIIGLADRGDLAGYAVLAPALIVLWRNALFEAGEIIETERWGGTLEGLVATPAPVGIVVLGRTLAVLAYGSLGFVASWATAALGFGILVPIHHPGWFVATVAATIFAMAGTCTIMAAVFVLARSARTFQNTLSYPIYVLGGVLVPVTLLPEWVQPLSRGIFLYWGADLLRDTLTPSAVEAPWFRLAMVVALGIAGFALGWWALGRILAKVRESGSLASA